MKESMYDVAIIGAGTAGSFAANQLTETGLTCCIIEKSRGVGGRCSRRTILDDFNVDLGGTGFSASNALSPSLINNINAWIKSGKLAEWAFTSSDFQTATATTTPISTTTPITAPTPQTIELCGTPSMNAFHRQLIKRVNCLTRRHVHKLKRLEGYWQLIDDSDQLIVEAKALIITAPAEQTYNLLQACNLVKTDHQIEHLSKPALNASQSSLPQYMCAIVFEHPQPQLSDVYTGNHPVFSKAIRANSKPNKHNTVDEKTPEVWVLHSTYDWAKQKNHQDAQTTAEEMAQLFCQHFNISVSAKTNAPTVVASHYWRLADHAHATHETGNKSFLWDESMQLGCCADWLAGGGIAAALSSSQDLSNHITSQRKQEG